MFLLNVERNFSGNIFDNLPGFTNKSTKWEQASLPSFNYDELIATSSLAVKLQIVVFDQNRKAMFAGNVHVEAITSMT